MTIATKSLSLTFGLAFVALTAFGCAAVDPAQSARGPGLPDPGADQEYQVNFPDPGHGVARYIGIAIDAELSKSCGLMRTYFGFDSDKLSGQDQANLKAVAECLERPELKGSKLSIVGRADSRGNTGYNAELGMKRAQSVKKLLIGAGIAEDRIDIASRGADGALGTDQPSDATSYGYDRRVDVILVGVNHAPR